MLTVKQIERAAAKKAAYKLADATGLYLHVSVTGRKTWRYNFLEAGRAQTKTYGSWPDDLTLAQARLAHAQICPKASRSGLDRSLRRHGLSNLHKLKPIQPKLPHKPFKSYVPVSPCGHQIPATDGR